MSKKVQKVPKLTDKVAPIALEVVEKDDEVKKVDTPEVQLPSKILLLVAVI